MTELATAARELAETTKTTSEIKEASQQKDVSIPSFDKKDLSNTEGKREAKDDTPRLSPLENDIPKFDESTPENSKDNEKSSPRIEGKDDESSPDGKTKENGNEKDSDNHDEFNESKPKESDLSSSGNKSDGVEQTKDGDALSTYDERLSHVPQEGERGHWEGERGESKFVPTENSEVQSRLEQYGQDGVIYKNGIPDFTPFSESNVEIDNMSDRRLGKGGNFDQADTKCAEQWNKDGKDGKKDWTAEDVKNWREDNGYSWHECNDRKTCQLVPTEINDYFGHLGGVSECKKANQQGSKFDA